jgi:23S rRNA (uracil1939-C5)-methyltransferase
MIKVKPPVEKNEYYDVIFEDLTHDGSGVAKIEGFPIFVPYGIPEEHAKIKVISLKKSYGFGRLVELYEKSPYRVEPGCPNGPHCGSCHLQHISYEGQLKAKHKLVKETLARIGGITNIPIHPVLGMKKHLQYRNKIQVPVGDREGGLIAGYYKTRSHEIVDMESCQIQHESLDTVFQKVKAILKKHGIRGYN